MARTTVARGRQTRATSGIRRAGAREQPAIGGGALGGYPNQHPGTLTPLSAAWQIGTTHPNAVARLRTG
eukprot:8452310-Alexandrium_andersonii.AAC.1